MKANELRIGNYVTYNPESVDEGTKIEPLQIMSISNFEDEFIAKLDEPFDNHYFEGELLPIPLTERWLEDFGFNCMKDVGPSPSDWNWVYRGFPLSIDNLTWRISVLKISIKYVHQLQNLYYALTGTELTTPNGDKT